MRTFKLLTLLTLGVAIFGSAGYFGYALFIKPSRVEKREKAAAASAPAPTPTPDPGIPEFQRLKSLQASGKIVEARDGWQVWIASNPKSRLLGQAKNQLGNANILLLFQPSANPSILTYTVVKGDSLAKIAGKQHSSAELIQKANQLPGINLQIGEQLLIPTLKISLELDRAAKTLTLFDNGVFLKEYPLLSAPSAPKSPTKISSKIIDKMATSGGKRIAFGNKDYPSSNRMIILSQSPAITSPETPDTESNTTKTPSKAPASTSPTGTTTNTTAQATPPPLPPGYVLSSEDLLELFPLVSRNTPVIIH